MQDKTGLITLTHSTLYAIQQLQKWVNQISGKTLNPISCEVKWVGEGINKEYSIEMGFGAIYSMFSTSPCKIWARFKIKNDEKGGWCLISDEKVHLSCSVFGRAIEYQVNPQGYLYDCPHNSLRAITAVLKAYTGGKE